MYIFKIAHHHIQDKKAVLKRHIILSMIELENDEQRIIRNNNVKWIAWSNNVSNILCHLTLETISCCIASQKKPILLKC